jgi:uncharacterized membrane protein
MNPSGDRHEFDRFAAGRGGIAAAIVLLLIALFLTAGPFVPAIAKPLRMPYVDPPVSILLALLAAGRIFGSRFNWKWRSASLHKIQWPLILGYGLLLSWISIHKHLAIDSHPDLGIFDNALWNTLHGRPLYSSILGRNFLGEHVAPILILLAPIYRLFPSPSTLLVVQSFALALAAVPVFWVADEHLGRGPALVLLAAYFVNRAILGAAFFDFHEIALAVPMLSFAFYCSERGRDALLVILLIVAVLCKEEVALVVSAFGVYLGLRRGWGRLPIVLIALGTFVFMFEYQVVLPFFRGRPAPYIDRYGYLGDTPGSIVASILAHPLSLAAAILRPPKIEYFLLLFGSVAFIPFLSPLPMIPVLPTLGRIALSGLPPEYSMDFHYSAELVPFLFFSTVFGMEKILRWIEEPRGRAFLEGFLGRDALRWLPPVEIVTAAVLVASGSLGRNPLRVVSGGRVMSDAAGVARLARQVPPDARIAADDTLVAHFSRRRHISILPILGDADYVLMDFAGDRYEYPLGREEHRRKLLDLTLRGDYAITWAQDGLVMLQRRKAAAEDASTALVDILFRFPRDSLQSSRSRGGDPRLHRATFTMPHLFPPGDYRVRFLLRAPARSQVEAKLAVSALKDNGNLHPQILARQELVLLPEGDREHEVELRFANPSWNLLQFAVMYPSRGSLDVDSIDVKPSGSSDKVLAQLDNY